MKITDEQVAHFHRRGFFLIPNPLGEKKVREVDRIQQDITQEWEQTDWPEGFNRLACQFFMVGELLLETVEQPHLVEMARRVLGCEEVHIGACGIGDASRVIAEDGAGPARSFKCAAAGAAGEPPAAEGGGAGGARRSTVRGWWDGRTGPRPAARWRR